MRMQRQSAGQVVFVDHYDSFSWNIRELLERVLHPDVGVMHYYYDDPELVSVISSMQRFQDSNKVAVVLSPGPKHPQDVPQSCQLYRDYHHMYSFLGICLGHQIIGFCEGFSIVRASSPIHGSTRTIYWCNGKDRSCISYFLPKNSTMATYNSLVLADTKGLRHSSDMSQNIASTTCMQVIAYDEKGDIAAIANSRSKLPSTLGVQFHPESHLSIYGDDIIRKFIKCAGIYVL